MDIPKLAQKLSKFLRSEIIFFVSALMVCVVLFLCAKYLPHSNSNWFSPWLFVFIGVSFVSIVVFFLLVIINSISALIISRDVNNSLKQNVPIEPQLIIKFKHKYHTLLIMNGIIICLMFASFFLYWFERNTSIGEKSMHIESASRERNEARRRLEIEPEHIASSLNRFKEIVSEYQTSTFVGYGEVGNSGNCVDPAMNSLFMIGDGFKPKTLIDSSRMHYLTVTNTDTPPLLYANDMNRRNFNNLNDARCFSNQDHFAYQLPSFFEKEYPKFYCIDDIHSDVQMSVKQIKGASCDDIDQNYLPPAEKPIPDTEYYKNFLNITEKDY